MQPFMIHYTASKHAVTGMARAFATELGLHSIRVNSVHPDRWPPTWAPATCWARWAAGGRDEHPTGAHGHTMMMPPYVSMPEDIADTVCWLATDESKCITASAIPADNGSGSVLIA